MKARPLANPRGSQSTVREAPAIQEAAEMSEDEILLSIRRGMEQAENGEYRPLREMLADVRRDEAANADNS